MWGEIAVLHVSAWDTSTTRPQGCLGALRTQGSFFASNIKFNTVGTALFFTHDRLSKPHKKAFFCFDFTGKKEGPILFLFFLDKNMKIHASSSRKKITQLNVPVLY